MKTEPTKENPAFLILHAVREHECLVGVGSLALVLKGSKDKKIWNRRLYNSKFFGALLYHPIDVIENFIKQLLSKGLLATEHLSFETYSMPMLRLTEAGKQALQEKTEIPLQVERKVKPVVLNESARQTLNLFYQCKDVSEVARQRGLVESTIYGHLITCIKLGVLASAEVVDTKKIKIIMKTKKQVKPKGLKELKEALPADVSYGEIRCVLAGME